MNFKSRLLDPMALGLGFVLLHACISFFVLTSERNEIFPFFNWRLFDHVEKSHVYFDIEFTYTFLGEKGDGKKCWLNNCPFFARRSERGSRFSLAQRIGQRGKRLQIVDLDLEAKQLLSKIQQGWLVKEFAVWQREIHLTTGDIEKNITSVLIGKRVLSGELQ